MLNPGLGPCCVIWDSGTAQLFLFPQIDVDRFWIGNRHLLIQCFRVDTIQNQRSGVYKIIMEIQIHNSPCNISSTPDFFANEAARSPLLLSPPWRVQPGETALQDCPAPGRRPSVLLLYMAERPVATLIMSGAFFSNKVLYEPTLRG